LGSLSYFFALDGLNALKFCFFCRNWSAEAWQGDQGCLLKLLHREKMKIHEILYIKYKKLCFSSKQGFEEKSITEHVIVEIFVAETLFDLLMCLLTIIKRLQDLIDKTLNLMRPKTLKMTFADFRTKNDCK